MSKILLSGYYGFNNFGDDLFPYVASLNFSDVDLYILSPRIKGVEGVRFLVPEVLSGIYKANGFFSRLLRMVFMVYGAFLTDHVVLAGGSVLASGSSNRMRRLQYFLCLFGVCKLSVVGVSVGPFTKEEDIVFYKKFSRRLSNFFVRDMKSYNVTLELLVVEPNFYGDIVGALPVAKPSNKFVKEPRVARLGVSLCEYPGVLSAGEAMSCIERSNYNEILDGVAKFCHARRMSESII